MGNKKAQRITVGVIIGVIVVSLALSLLSTASATSSPAHESARSGSAPSPPDERAIRGPARPAPPRTGRNRFCPGAGRLLTFPLVAPLAQLAEQVTLNHWVRGSSPWRRTSRPPFGEIRTGAFSSPARVPTPGRDDTRPDAHAAGLPGRWPVLGG